MEHATELLKVAEILMILSFGEVPYKLTSYIPKLLLPVIVKLFEKPLI